MAIVMLSLYMVVITLIFLNVLIAMFSEGKVFKFNSFIVIVCYSIYTMLHSLCINYYNHKPKISLGKNPKYRCDSSINFLLGCDF